MPRGGGKSNGGIIGKVNKTSFGKDKVTDKTATGNVCLQSGTRVVKAAIIAGGGGGGRNRAAGGGGGGLLNKEFNAEGTVPVVIGGGGPGTNPCAPGTDGSVSSFNGTCATGGGGGAEAQVAGNPGDLVVAVVVHLHLQVVLLLEDLELHVKEMLVEQEQKIVRQ